MQLKEGRVLISASDLMAFLECEHVTKLDFAALSADGKTALTGGDKTTRVWEVSEGTPASSLLVHQVALVLPLLKRWQHVVLKWPSLLGAKPA